MCYNCNYVPLHRWKEPILVYDNSARTQFLQLSFEEALEELSTAVNRNFGDRSPDEEWLGNLLETTPKSDWRTNEPIRMQLKWLSVGRDSLADRARIVLLKRGSPHK